MGNSAIKNWLHEQTLSKISQFDKSMEENNPESQEWVKDAQKSYNRICIECNYLSAIEMIDWDGYLKKNSVLMDLAGGAGWLSGHLSKLDNVEKIYFLDSSKFYIEEMMPVMVDIMGGAKNKIEPIEGLFSPLLFSDSFLDAVVVSSALHHADNLEIVLMEIRRVLKDDGCLFILNETPLSSTRYLILMLKKFIQIFLDSAFRIYRSKSPSISSSGILYDPILEDRIYPLWYWLEVIERSGLKVESSINTGMTTVKGQKGIKLRHIICKKGRKNKI